MTADIRRQDPPIRPTDRSRLVVLDALAPLTSIYVRRAQVGSPPPSPSPEPSRAADPVSHFTSCEVHVVTKVEDDLRVPWPQHGIYSSDEVALRVTRGVIEVDTQAPSGAFTQTLDARGRLGIPRGLVRAAGLARGDRVALVSIEDTPRLLLVRADRLAVPMDGAL